MGEQFAQVGEIELCYDQFGDPGDEPLLLIMGLGTPMNAWPVPFCERLAERGFFVTRFDNRDIGRSTILRELGVPPLRHVLTGRRSTAPYRLSAMAADSAGLLDTLGIGAAHIVGASMGGMIAQLLAIEHPRRVRSLTSIMSNTGRKGVGAPHPQVLRAFLKPPPREAALAVDHVASTFRAIGSPPPLYDEHAIREIATESLQRGISRNGTLRQLAAITSASDRTRRLHDVRVPTLVIHGSADKLVDPSGGRATARAVPGATYLQFGGMGHDLPESLWPLMLSAISDNARRAPHPPAFR